MARAQAWLLNYKNPLKTRFEPKFFSSIPRSPGVYFMYNAKDELLYVGKSKCLRARILSYKRAKPGEAPRKVLRLLKLVHRIAWELCESNVAAILRENSLLRTHKPPFNIVNTRPERYYFIGLDRIGGQLQFQLTTKLEGKAGLFFGAFKGRAQTRDAYGALLRLIWASQSGMRARGRRFEYPARLAKPRPPIEYHLELASDLGHEDREGWVADIQGFLYGDSDALLGRLFNRLLLNSVLHKMYYAWIQEDFDLLRDFYTAGPSRNSRLASMDRRTAKLIPQDELDDLLAVFREEILAGERHT